MPKHGFASDLLGRRTRSLGSGGNRVGVSVVGTPLGGMIKVARRTLSFVLPS